MEFTKYRDAGLFRYFADVFADALKNVFGPEIHKFAPAWQTNAKFAQKRDEVSYFYRLLTPYLDVLRLPGADAKGTRAEYVQKSGALPDAIRDLLLGRFVHHMISLEDQLGFARAARMQKFYREHLNHMVRTLLLSSFLIAEIRQNPKISLTNLDLDSFLLACLFHDISQPVQEVRMIVEGLAKPVRGLGFKAVKVGKPTVRVSRDDEGALQFFQQLAEVNERYKLTNVDGGRLSATLLKEYRSLNHGVLSSYETSLMLQGSALSSEKVKKGLLAIALHEPFDDFPVKVELLQFPELYLLVLADALQDWGRPLYPPWEPSGFIGNITDEISIHVNNQKELLLAFRLDYSSADTARETYTWDTLRQLEDKNKSLARLKTNGITLEVCFHLPHYPPKGRQYQLPEEIKLVMRGSTKRWYPKLSGHTYEDSLSYLEELTASYRQTGGRLSGAHGKVSELINTIYILSKLGITDDRVLDVAIDTIKYSSPKELVELAIGITIWSRHSTFHGYLLGLSKLPNILEQNLALIKQRRPNQLRDLLKTTTNIFRRYPELMDFIDLVDPSVDIRGTVKKLRGELARLGKTRSKN